MNIRKFLLTSTALTIMSLGAAPCYSEEAQPSESSTPQQLQVDVGALVAKSDIFNDKKERTFTDLDGDAVTSEYPVSYAISDCVDHRTRGYSSIHPTDGMPVRADDPDKDLYPHPEVIALNDRDKLIMLTQDGWNFVLNDCPTYQNAINARGTDGKSIKEKMAHIDLIAAEVKESNLHTEVITERNYKPKKGKFKLTSELNHPKAQRAPRESSWGFEYTYYPDLSAGSTLRAAAEQNIKTKVEAEAAAQAASVAASFTAATNSNPDATVLVAAANTATAQLETHVRLVSTIAEAATPVDGTKNATDTSPPASATNTTETPAPATAAANITADPGGTTGSDANTSGAEGGSTGSAGDDSKSSSDDQGEQQQSSGDQQESSEQQQGQTNEESKSDESDEGEDDLDPQEVKAQEVPEGDKKNAAKAQNHLKDSGIELNDKASHAQQIIELADKIQEQLQKIAATSDEAIKQLINETAKGLVVPVPQFSNPDESTSVEAKLTFLQQQISALEGYNPTAGSINQDTLITQVTEILKAENDLMDSFEAITKVQFAETFREIKALQKELTDKISEFEEIAKTAKTTEEREMAERQAEALRAQEAAAARAVDKATQEFDQLKTEAQSKHQSATSETETSLSNIATSKVKSTRVRAQALGTSKQAAEKLEKQKVRLTALNVKVTALSSEFRAQGAKFSGVKESARAQIESLKSNRTFKKHIEDKNLSTLVSIFGQGLGSK